MLFPLAGLFRLDALGLGHSVYGRLQVVELGMHGLERLFHFLRDDGLLTEGCFTNLFVERDGKLLTPPAGLGLSP